MSRVPRSNERSSASQGFSRRKGASHIRVDRVNTRYDLPNWRHRVPSLAVSMDPSKAVRVLCPSVCAGLGLSWIYPVLQASTGSRGASLAMKFLRILCVLVEPILCMLAQTGDPTASTNSLTTKSESHPHTALMCVRFRGHNRQTPRVDTRNTLQCSPLYFCDTLYV